MEIAATFLFDASRYLYTQDCGIGAGAMIRNAGRRILRIRQPMHVLTAERGNSVNRLVLTAALLSGLALAGCQSTPTGELGSIDQAQGSSENISSLSSVVDRNPRDPEAYNVRGSALGRGGKYQAALKDFDTAIQLKPDF